MLRLSDGLDDCIKAIDAVVKYFGIEWEYMDAKEKRRWMEDFARKHSHPACSTEENTDMENKQHICDLLTETLKATRDQADLARIRYEEIGPDHQQVVLDYDGGGHRSVNVSLDSGIAMVRDILRALQ